MTVEVSLENRSGFRLDEAAVRGALAGTLAACGVGAGEVGVAFVPADEIAVLNGRHRGLEEPTDVLSFPLDGLEPLPDGVPRQLGDLVVCPEVAAAEGTALERLLVHGALHLCGYDHETDAGEMLERERTLAAEVGRVAAEPA